MKPSSSSIRQKKKGQILFIFKFKFKEFINYKLFKI